MLKTTVLFALLTCTLASWCARGNLHAEDNWNQFRGPRGDGKTTAVGLATEWSETKNVTWKTAVHGRAWSSPVLWDDQLWLTTAPDNGEKLYALCINPATGAIERDILIFEVEFPQYCHPENTYASPTSFIEQGRIYVHYGVQGTACIDTATGEIVWKRADLHCDHFRGAASSPIVEGNLLFLTFDGVDVQYVTALDKRTGETVWQVDRDIQYETDNPDKKKAYSTPHLITAAGRRQLVSQSAGSTISYNPLTGEEWWRIQHGGMNAASRPLFAHGLLYLSAGEGTLSFLAMKPDGLGNVTDTHIVWSTGKSAPGRASYIIEGDLLFFVSDKGVASCLDAKTGEVHWMKRLGGEFWASPLYSEGKIYYFSKQGSTPVVAASKEYKLITENQFDAPFYASPAVKDQALFLRTETHLYRVEK